jgi:hypothetical protein
VAVAVRVRGEDNVDMGGEAEQRGRRGGKGRGMS